MHVRNAPKLRFLRLSKFDYEVAVIIKIVIYTLVFYILIKKIGKFRQVLHSIIQNSYFRGSHQYTISTFDEAKR
jgi:hypothetical protein